MEPGTVFSFRTSPIFAESPAETGRYGAVKILGHNRDLVVLAALEGVWPAPPTLAEVADRPILRSNRFGIRNQPAVFGCGARDTVDELPEFAFIGPVPLTPEHERIVAKYLGDDRIGCVFSSPGKANSDIEGEWRWANDREAFLQERARSEERKERERAAAEERYRTRLKDLTWEQLLVETPFERWAESPPFPPAEFRDAAAERVHETYRELRAHGPKPRKAAARKALTALTAWLKEADERAGLVLETEEREDIHLVLEEIAYVAKHPSLLGEVEDWYAR